MNSKQQEIFRTAMKLRMFVRAHGFSCGFGNGRLAIGIPYSRKLHGRILFPGIETILVKPDFAEVRKILGY